MFENFQTKAIDSNGISIHARMGGSGPPLLLLHGYPQTHVCWHKVANQLAERFTVVVSDLRGYGDSSKPAGGEKHENYSKRAMAADQVALMRALGFEKFQLVGHDRGARVAHRLALDYGEAVERWAVLDIAPTLAMYESTNQAFATAYYHWFFLIQPFDLPERLIGADAEFYLKKKLRAWGRHEDAFTREAVAAYARSFCNPATIHATCEDYRAAATIDLEHDRADRGRKVAAPLLALWGAQGVIGRMFDALGLWRECAENVEGKALPGGHFIPEEAPGELLEELWGFLQA